jgi:GNAT superfamily N-acetyltransferase
VVDLRPATEADLPEIYSIWYQTEIDGVPDPPAPADNPWLGHILRTGHVVVATDPSGWPVGFAAARKEGALTVLTDCFVRPGAQSGGVGSALLDAVLPRDEPLATFASSDPRAVASYARRGMIPRWPAYYLTAGRQRISIRHPATAEPAGEQGRRMLSQGTNDWQFWTSLGATCLEVRHEDA